LYVVTICTQGKTHLFGDIRDSQMHPNPAGEMVQRTWDEIPTHYSTIDIDAFVVMPNHIHGIILLVPQESDLYPGSDRAVGATPVVALVRTRMSPVRTTIPSQIQRAKSFRNRNIRVASQGNHGGLPLPGTRRGGRCRTWCIDSKR
jgi:hypothetical protein